jgi:hypothetical protein
VFTDNLVENLDFAYRNDPYQLLMPEENEKSIVQLSLDE